MQNPYEHIESYLAGSLSLEDKAAFEAAMTNDNQLQLAVDDFGFMDLIGEALVEEEISRVVGEELESSNFEAPAKTTKLSKYYSRVAAALVIAILGWWASTLVTAKTNSQLFAEVVTEPVWPGVRSDRPTKIERFIALYQSGKQQIGKDSLVAFNSEESNYWLSELYLKEQKFDSTLLFLELDMASDDNIRRDRKLFVHIVALYFSGDKFRAKTAYESLPEDVDEYYTNRVQLLSF